MSGPGKARLAVLVDGAPLGDDEARETWQKFSAHMEEHKGDLAGFARSLGFTSAHPTSDNGRAVLVLSRTRPQDAYGAPEPAKKKPAPGGRPRR